MAETRHADARRPVPSSPLRDLLVAPRSTPQIRAVVTALVVAAAVGGALSGAHPSGLTIADPALDAAGAAALAWSASRAHRSAWIVAAGIAAAFASGIWVVLAILALVAAAGGALLPRRSRVLGALIGGLSAQALLRLPSTGLMSEFPHHGASAIVGVVASLALLVSGYRRATVPERRWLRRALGYVALVLVIGTGMLVLCGLLVKRDVDAGLVAARRGLDDARAADTTSASEQFQVASARLGHADSVLGAWWLAPVRALPLVGQQAEALAVVSDHASKLASAAQVAAQTGDYHDLRYQSGRFDLTFMERLQGPLAGAATSLDRTDRAIDHLPLPWLVPPLRHKIDSLETEVRQAEPAANLASSAVNVGPGLFGGNGQRRYLVLFTTPAEQRGLGGFIGAYGELTANGGGLRLTRSGPIADLIDAVPLGTRVLHAPKDYVERYGSFDPQDFLQDLTLSPDFPSVASVASDLYWQSVHRRVNGVLLLDPYGLAALLKLTGPVQVPGLNRPLSAAQAPDLLLRTQYLIFPHSTDRQNLLIAALKSTFKHLSTGDLPGPSTLGKVLGPAVRDGRLMLWSASPPEQAVVRDVDADGAFPRPDGGDFLSVRSQNSGHNKIDAYLHRTITDSVLLEPATNQEKATVTIALHNSAPDHGMPDYVIGNTDPGLPVGANQMTLAVYSPLFAEQATVDGKIVGVGPGNELGWSVATMRVTVPAHHTTVVVITFEGTLPLDRGYDLRVSPQPAATVTHVAVDVSTVPGWRAGPGERLHQAGSEVSGGGAVDHLTRYSAGLVRSS